MADTIDASRLPSSALIDSSVLIAAFGARTRRTDDPACRAFCEAMIAKGSEILIAAPSLTEVLMGMPKSEIPLIRSIRVVAFDALAATMLATKFPKTILIDLKNKQKTPDKYIKYDALIAACALRHRADVLISSDDHQRSIAERAGMTARKASYYWSKQPSLPNVK